jgi:hypothetical protein
MLHLFGFEPLSEDGTAYANASIGGAGGVSNSQVGPLPGVPGNFGSGDSSSVLRHSDDIGKGNPSEVSDLRNLSSAKGVNKVDDLKKGKRKNSFKRFSDM